MKSLGSLFSPEESTLVVFFLAPSLAGPLLLGGGSMEVCGRTSILWELELIANVLTSGPSPISIHTSRWTVTRPQRSDPPAIAGRDLKGSSFQELRGEGEGIWKCGHTETEPQGLASGEGELWVEDESTS